MTNFSQYELTQDGIRDVGKNFNQFEIPDKQPEQLNIVPVAGGSTLKDGEFKSPNYVTKKKGWRVDSEGHAEFQDITASNIDIVQSFIADQDLSAGQLVGISFDVDNTIARAFAPYFNTTTADTTINGNGNVCPLGSDDKFVFVYGTATNTLKAVIGTVNRATRSISWGTSVTVSTDVDQTGQTYQFAVCKIDTNKFVVSYVSDADPTIGKVIVATVSGTTISFGTAATFYDHATNDISTIASAGISTDKLAIAIEVSNSDVFSIAVSVSGTTPTAGTAVALNANTYNTGLGMMVVKLDTDKFVVWGNTYLQCGTVSGTTITLGTAVDSSLDLSFATGDIVSHDTDKFIIVLGSTAKVCTTSGTTITVNSGQTVSNGIMRVVSSTELRVYAETVILKWTVSGSTITETTIGRGIETIANNNVIRPALTNLSNDYWIILYLNTTSNLRTVVRGNSFGFIGVVQTPASRGQEVEVKIAGIDYNQSSLTPGALYNIDASSPGALQLAATSNLDTPREITLFQAITTSSILIK